MSQIAESCINFYDQHPVQANLYDEVIRGLQMRPRTIPPKFFYDEEGSRLFDAICETAEYYPTRTEISILERNVNDIAKLLGSGCLLVEPGSGSSQKVRTLLDAVRPSAYMPMDISGEYLRMAAEEIVTEYPWLDVHAACTDFTEPLDLPYCPPDVHKIAFFPGSSIGNFEPDQAVVFLSNIARMVQQEGGLLIGVDLKKDNTILDAAYNDAEGLTAAFNLNLLSRINRELDGNFDLDGFHHHAFYSENIGRVEMHLISSQDQMVSINSHRFEFAEGENIHTENSYKYDIDEFHSLAARAGFTPVQVWTDADRLFSIHYLTVTR